jgi:nickel-type superoxide dismutase maturation protease
MFFPFSRFKITGHSMEPLFKEGDRLLINRFSYLFSSPNPGDIVAIKDPNSNKQILLKKIEKVESRGKYLVEGLNKSDSLDSRSFGTIEKSRIIGKFWRRY